MKKLHICLALVLIIVMAFGMLTVASAEGEAVFEVSLVPQEGTAEVGGVVTVDVIIKNLTDSTKKINAFELEIDMSDGLTFNAFTKAIPGNFTSQPSVQSGLMIVTFFSGSNSRIITLQGAGATGGSDAKKIGTLTFDVASSGLTNGQILEVLLTDETNVHLTGTMVTEPCTFVNGQVEIVAEDVATGDGPAEGNEPAGEGTDATPAPSEPSTGEPATAEPSPANDGNSSEEPKESAGTAQTGTEEPSTTGSVFGRPGTMAIIVAAILVIIAAVVLISRKKKS